MMLLVLATPTGIQEKLQEQGHSLDFAHAKAAVQRFQATFPILHKWQLSKRGLSILMSPLGQKVMVPQNKRHIQAVLAGVLQSAEADALRIVLAESGKIMNCTGAEIVLVNHDEVVWEVPTKHAEEAARRAEDLMKRALFSVCSPCPAAVAVDIRTSWARPEKGGGDTAAEYSILL